MTAESFGRHVPSAAEKADVRKVAVAKAAGLEELMLDTDYRLAVAYIEESVAADLGFDWEQPGDAEDQ